MYFKMVLLFCVLNYALLHVMNFPNSSTTVVDMLLALITLIIIDVVFGRIVRAIFVKPVKSVG